MNKKNEVLQRGGFGDGRDRHDHAVSELQRGQSARGDSIRLRRAIAPRSWARPAVQTTLALSIVRCRRRSGGWASQPDRVGRNAEVHVCNRRLRLRDGIAVARFRCARGRRDMHDHGGGQRREDEADVDYGLRGGVRPAAGRAPRRRPPTHPPAQDQRPPPRPRRRRPANRSSATSTLRSCSTSFRIATRRPVAARWKGRCTSC